MDNQMNDTDPRENEFQAGVTAAMRRWTGLRAAVEGEWGGPESKRIAEDLRSNILEKFRISSSTSANQKRKLPMEVEDLEDAIAVYMEEEFSAILEDDSPKFLAKIIIDMYMACVMGNFQICREMVAAANREEQSRSSESFIVKDAEDGQVDDALMDEGNAPNVVRDMPACAEEYASQSLFGEEKKHNQGNIPPPRQLGEAVEKMQEDELDEDGFAPVRRSRRSNKGCRPGVNC